MSQLFKPSGTDLLDTPGGFSESLIHIRTTGNVSTAATSPAQLVDRGRRGRLLERGRLADATPPISP